MRVDEFDRIYEVEIDGIDEIHEVDDELDGIYAVRPTARGIFEKTKCQGF